jgi:hypothetical protein
MYADNPVIRVKGIGKKAEGLLKRNGIKTVANLCALTKVTRPEGLTAKALTQYLTNCEDALSENAPSITYYTEANNPFAARYEEKEDDWVSQSGFQRSRAHQCLSIKSVLQILQSTS